jgi:hypothetical protein
MHILGRKHFHPPKRVIFKFFYTKSDYLETLLQILGNAFSVKILDVFTQFKGPHNALSLIQEFGKYGPLEKVTIVIDGKSGRSRGFAFIKFQNVEDATQARNALTDTGKDEYSQVPWSRERQLGTGTFCLLPRCCLYIYR